MSQAVTGFQRACAVHSTVKQKQRASTYKKQLPKARKGIHVEADFALSFVLIIMGATLCHPMFHE